MSYDAAPITSLPLFRLIPSVSFDSSQLLQLPLELLASMAVVHPITYLGLKKTKGTRIRNVATGFVWILCLPAASLMSIELSGLIAISICVVAFDLIVVSLCSLRVLRVLMRPGPREESGTRWRVDQSKLRSFCSIMAIVGMLLFRSGGNLFTAALCVFEQIGETGKSDMLLSLFLSDVPASLLLPLLLVQRAGKLMCCGNCD